MNPIDAVPVLLIENDQDQAGQVIDCLKGGGYRVEHSPLGAAAEVFAFKANALSTQLFIVDLDLQGKREPNPSEGEEIVKKLIWPLDRAAYFIIFSKHAAAHKFRSPGRIEPNWVVVEKKSDSPPDGRPPQLTAECLDELRRVVDECRECIVPRIRSPQFDGTRYLAIVDKFQSLQQVRSNPVVLSDLRSSISRSVYRLMHLAHECAAYARAGLSTANVSIAVYGSYGRLEARPNSDLEFSVFYDSGSDKDVSPELIVSMWNRLAYTLHADPDAPEFEGSARIEKGNLLLAKEVDGVLPNAYVEVIDVNSYKKPFNQYPLLRARHLQFLCECRAVFNPVALQEMKLNALSSQIGMRPKDLRPLMNKFAYWDEIFTQFQMETAPKGPLNWRAWKTVTYRALNVISTKIGLAGLLRFNNPQLQQQQEYADLFDWLSYPGLLKLMALYTAISEANDSTATTVLFEKLSQLINSYGDILSMLSLGDDQLTGTRAPLLKLCDLFAEVVALLKQGPLGTVVMHDWLLSNDHIDRLRSHILALQ